MSPRPVPTHPAPAFPPREWFLERPALESGQGFAIDDDGRVGGWVWLAGQTSSAFTLTSPNGKPRARKPGETGPWRPPPTLTGHEAFHDRPVMVADGRPVRVGKLVLGHFGEQRRVVARVRAHEDASGCWFAGVLEPRLTRDEVDELRTMSPSGEWLPQPAAFYAALGVEPPAGPAGELVGIALVDVPALPYPPAPAAPMLGDRHDRATAQEWAERRDRQAAAQWAARRAALVAEIEERRARAAEAEEERHHRARLAALERVTERVGLRELDAQGPPCTCVPAG